jgi:hypothetical protein
MRAGAREGLEKAVRRRDPGDDRSLNAPRSFLAAAARAQGAATATADEAERARRDGDADARSDAPRSRLAMCCREPLVQLTEDPSHRIPRNQER